MAQDGDGPEIEKNKTELILQRRVGDEPHQDAARDKHKLEM